MSNLVTLHCPPPIPSPAVAWARTYDAAQAVRLASESVISETAACIGAILSELSEVDQCVRDVLEMLDMAGLDSTDPVPELTSERAILTTWISEVG